MQVSKFVLSSALALIASVAFAADKMPVAKDSAQPGEGKNVTLFGNSVPLGGSEIKVGDKLPNSMLTNGKLEGVDLAATSGKVRIISVVPSVDTPTCEAQTHELSEQNGGLDKNVELVTVSMDLPFAQGRFAKEAKISNVTFLSDYKSAEFGNSNGLLVKPLHLLARAVIVTDKDNVVRYLQVVPELTHLPDMAEAFKVAKSLL